MGGDSCKGKIIRILMLAPTPFFSDRGCHVRIFEEAEALRECGHEVGIVTYHNGRDVGRGPLWRIPYIPWYTKQSAGPSWQKPFLDILLFFKAVQAIRQWKPDLLHAHLHEGAFVGWFLKKLFRLPLLFDCQGSLTGELVDHKFVNRESMLFQFFYFLEKKINQGADTIVASSMQTAGLLREEFEMSVDKVKSLIDGVVVEKFCMPSATRLTELKVTLNLPKDKPLVVYLGAMNQYQGIDLLLEMIKCLCHRGVNSHFLLMGYPEESYRTKAVAMGIGHHVTFAGKVEYSQINEYLALGDVAVSPKLSATEANGKLFNYMAAGLPTVAFESPVNREILGNLGRYACFGDVNALAGQVEVLLTEQHLWEVLGAQLKAYAAAHHTWSSRVSRLEQVYEEMLTSL